MSKIVTYEIEYCNSGCPHFYHKYEDDDNVWCGLLDKKIFDFGESILLYGDSKKREIPKECPLQDAPIVLENVLSGDDGWLDYLHYGRVLTEEEHELLNDEFLRRLKDDDFKGLPTTREERLKYLEKLKHQ